MQLNFSPATTGTSWHSVSLHRAIVFMCAHMLAVVGVRLVAVTESGRRAHTPENNKPGPQPTEAQSHGLATEKDCPVMQEIPWIGSLTQTSDGAPVLMILLRRQISHRVTKKETLSEE